MTSAVRHVLTDNHWELQCPVCRVFVPISRAVFIGDAPLPRHAQPSPLWRRIWFGPDWCGFRPCIDWATLQWHATGLTSFGPVDGDL